MTECKVAMPEQVDLVLAHGHCVDGFCSMFVAWWARGTDAEYRQVFYGEPPPDVRGRHVAILDFSYKREILKRMAEDARSIILLDHHSTSEKDLRSWRVHYIPLPTGEEAIVDEGDYDLVSSYSWALTSHGTGVAAYAGGGRKNSRTVYLSRLILGEEAECVDHINRNVLDNRRCNLRSANKQQNAANMDRGSDFKGVTRRRDKWIAQITIAGKHKYLGIFDAPETAAQAYDLAALEAFGEFARGNFLVHKDPPPPPPRNVEIIFDMDRSGAKLALDWFSTAHPFPRCVRTLVDYVQDRDLWRWALPDSKAVSEALRAIPFDDGADPIAKFEQWITFAEELESHYDRVVERGQAMLDATQLRVESWAQHAALGSLGDIETWIVNAPYTNCSELGNLLAARPGPGVAIVWRYDHAKGRFSASLRSTEASGVDVSAIAKRYGGGGHKHAAGFEFDLNLWALLTGTIVVSLGSSDDSGDGVTSTIGAVT